MGGIVSGSLVGEYDPNIVDGGPATILKQANNDDQEALNRLAGGYTFKVHAFTDSTETADVINLNDQGVTFPVNTVRNIRTKAWARNAAGTKVAYSESLVPVIGNGSTAAALSAVTAAPATDLFLDPRYVARAPLVGSASATVETSSAAVKFLTAIPAITGGEVVIRIGGGLTAVDLSWYVEVEVGKLNILPVAVAAASS
jgi:hypothetical protein